MMALVGSFMRCPSDVSCSTGVPYTALLRLWNGRGGGKPPHHCAAKPMTANKPTPPNGESVSDGHDLEDVLADEVIECRHLLRQTVQPDADPQEIELCVKEAKARLDHLERVVEKAVN